MEIQNFGSIARRGKKTHRSILIRGLLLIGIGLSAGLGACSAVKPAAPTQTSAPVVLPVASDTATPAPTSTQTAVPATITPSPTATLPLSAVAVQALKDAFNCLTFNINYAPSINLTQYCSGYWDNTSSNMYTLDGAVIEKQLEPYLTPLANLRWRFDSLSSVQKDERLSTTVNPIYTGLLSTVLTGNINLNCPSGTPAPLQTTVNIPIKGEARISVYNYLNQAQETIQIESWTIQGNPLQDYCTTLH
jgi:hypothetical protein